MTLTSIHESEMILRQILHQQQSQQHPQQHPNSTPTDAPEPSTTQQPSSVAQTDEPLPTARPTNNVSPTDRPITHSDHISETPSSTPTDRPITHSDPTNETPRNTPTDRPITPSELPSNPTPTDTRTAPPTPPSSSSEITNGPLSDAPTVPTSDGVDIGSNPSTGDTPIPPSGENNINELPENRVNVVTTGDGQSSFSLRQFDITNSAYFELAWRPSNPSGLIYRREFLPNQWIPDSDVNTVVQDVLSHRLVYFIEITSFFDHETCVRLQIRFGYTLNQVRTTILDFTDTRPLWISYAGFATRNGFQGDFLVYDFIYEHGTILRTFFQTNMNSHSVGTPELGPDERQLNFGLKASASGVIILSESSSLSGAHYEIEIGAENNMKSIIKYGGSILVEVDTIDILDADNYVEFWISLRSGAIRVGKVGSLEFMSWQGSLPEIRFAFFESGIHSASNIYYWFVFKYYYFSQARGGIFYTHDINQAYQYHYTELRREGGGAYIEFGIKADGEY
ncbi:hypothetical protein BSL78_23746 [Apostichopus japonicus]|uniref:Farnesoic acid O-methyl transferase domain-containing protein n=1 Tax=Stichopus japonicus TaxID=307972 RepID=A0A2G8JUN6_STIJA|nr:hypothetical protein BSL78_23746 [Apostichopus japonicus]